MIPGSKDFIRKDCRDIVAIASRIDDNLGLGKDESWPHRLAELEALVEDIRQWVIILHGGQGNFDAASRQAMFNG